MWGDEGPQPGPPRWLSVTVLILLIIAAIVWATRG
jgi:hypothetical protein